MWLCILMRINLSQNPRRSRGLPAYSMAGRAQWLPIVVVWTATLAVSSPAVAQRLLGLDVSAHQSDISTAEWATLKRPTNQQVGGVFGDGRDFVIIRSSRGGTTGEDHRQGGYPSGNNTFFNQSERYDDPYFIQNITRATDAGLFAGTYHFARPDVIIGTVNSDGSTVAVANTGTDEANHFMQMAGPWMRPGYLQPMYDFEAGQSQRSAEELAQFSIDFSERIYQVMGIRPSIYVNGSYNLTLADASQGLRDQIAQPAGYGPTMVSPAYSTVVMARWPNQGNPGAIDVQNGNPGDSLDWVYGIFDDYGTTHPWQFWQYASTMKLNGNNNKTSNTDVDVSRGDIEWVKDQLIPAVWMNNSSGDWSTLANWNSGQTPVAPPQLSGQLAPFATGPLPAARLPGAAGSGPTAGSNDTVILERPGANITVTLSTGSYNIRKLYMREALNITGGTLTINYDPNYVSDTVTYPNAVRSGPISAQFSGPVSLGGSGSLSVNTLQVDPSQTFTLAGSTGTLTFKTINLMPHSVTPAKIAMTGNANIDPLSNSTATIANGSGGGATGFVDLGGATRIFNVGNGTSDVDLAVNVPIQNGGLTKNGLGTMLLGGPTTLTGAVTINDGILRVTANNQLGTTGVTTNMTVVTPGSGGSGHGGTLQLSGNVSYNLPLTIGGGGVSGVSNTPPGSPGAFDNSSGDNTWSGTVTLAGTASSGTDPLENQIGAQAGTLRVTGVIQNAAGVAATWAKTGDGDVVLGGAAVNTYSGLTRLFGGRMIIEKDGALGTAGSINSTTENTFQISGSASTLAFRAPTGSSAVSFNTFEVINTNGTGAPGLGQVDNLGGNNKFAGQIAFDGPSVGGARQVSIGVASGSLNVSGGLFARGSDGSPRNLTKLGAGTLIVSGDGSAGTGNSLVVPLVNSTVNVNAGTMEMRGPSLTTANLPGVMTWNVASGGTLLASSGRFTTGTVNVSAGGAFNVSGGSTDLATINLVGGGSAGLTGGTLHVQNVQGSLANQGGTLAPGMSPGSTNITGSYTQESGGTLGIEIGGAAPGTGFDFVNVGGVATLAGILDVSLINSFTPTPGQEFTVLTASSVTNNGLTLGGSAANLFNLLIGPSSVLLQAPFAGDFSRDGDVNAADYVTWRKGEGTTYPSAQYVTWRSDFGQASSAGASGSALDASAAVPEPATILILTAGLLPLLCGRRLRIARGRHCFS
jgi:autotransporter-associated beta strand protein